MARTSVEIDHAVRQLYETHPYPNWHDKLAPAAVEQRIRLFNGLNVPLEAFRDARILDAGCGTGKKTLIMASFGPRRVIGVDRALAPLQNAKAWAQAHRIANVTFVQGSVLDLGFLRPNSMDIVHCAGVLHHTPDPARGVKGLVKVLKPGGYLILYVYNPYGRAYLRAKQTLVRWLAGAQPARREYWTKRLFRMWEEPSRDASAVYHDFYCHPHESYHPLGEVFAWLDQNGLEFCGIYPSVSFREPGSRTRPGVIRRFLVQLFALVYVLLRRTHIGWAVAGRKGHPNAG